MVNALSWLIPDEPDPDARYIWGTVTGTAPLTVRPDNETSVMFVNSNLAGPLSVGSRVLVMIAGRSRTVLGPPSPRVYSSTRIETVGGITGETVIPALSIIAPRSGNARLALAASTSSTGANDVFTAAIRVGGTAVRAVSGRANSATFANTGNFLEFSAPAIVQQGQTIDVTLQRVIGDGNVSLGASATTPATLWLTYID